AAHPGRHRQVRSRDAATALPGRLCRARARTAPSTAIRRNHGGPTRALGARGRDARLARPDVDRSGNRPRDRLERTVSRTILSVRGLALRAGSRLSERGADLGVRPGECIALLGRNGTGKSLTLHTLAGLREPGGGQIELDGRALDTYARRAIAQHIGLLLQDL